MDPIIIRYLIYGLVSAAIVSAAVCAPQLNQARDEIAFVKGYTHALEVHGLDAHSDDRTVWDGFKAGTACSTPMHGSRDTAGR